MVQFDQRLIFNQESGQRILYPGMQSSILRLEIEKGSCIVYGKLFKLSEPVQLAGVNASDYSTTNTYSPGLYTLDISGMQELILICNSPSVVSAKLVY